MQHCSNVPNGCSKEYQGSTLTFETSGPPGPPEANSTRPNSNLGGPV